MRTARLAVDIGGTFTDVVIEQGETLFTAKVPTTVAAPEQGFLEGVDLVLAKSGLAAGEISCIIHGTTLATNALIERKGAKTALITTEGFRDTLEIAYEARFDQYDLFLEKPAPLIARRLRFTVPERCDALGRVLTPLDEAAVERLVPVLRERGIEALAVGFLHAYANPDHERRVREILRSVAPEIAVSLSGEVCPELREYERLSTTAANAYVQPLMAGYLTALDRALRGRGFACPLFLVTSAGAMTTLDMAVRFPIRLVESGPSGGAILARTIARQCAEPRVLSYDMGGTTAKICLIEDGTPRTARSIEVARTARLKKGSGLPLRIPVVEMIEIGAGGGSLARVDDLNRLTVGPDSAAAKPGPACYGVGGERATVTDADLVIGRLDAEAFAEGRLALSAERARSAIEADVAGPLDLSVPLAACGISEMVEETMANAARVHAVEHGKDLTGWTMIAFGGAGPLHAGRLVEKLGLQRLIVPLDPGVGSAVGFLRAPIAYEILRSRFTTLSDFAPEAIDHLFRELAEEGRGIIAAGAPGAPLGERRIALMRYNGQGHELEIEVPPGPVTVETGQILKARYEARYVELFGRCLPDVDIEVLTWSLTVSTADADPAAARRESQRRAAPLRGRQRLFDPERDREIDVETYWRADLSPGMTLDGPALITESQTTTVLPAGFRLLVDSLGNLVIDRLGARDAGGEAAGGLAQLRRQVAWNRLQAVVDEQAQTLMRTAFSPIVRESGDLSAGSFDLAGRMLTQAVTGTPGHVNSMAAAVANFFEFFPRQDMRPGDIYLTNDPWLGSGHLNDFVLVKPCFLDGALVGFVSCTSHLVDIGGQCLGPDGGDVYDEGLYIPPIRLVDRGELNQTLMALLKANSRIPNEAEGDVHALIACCEVGDERLIQMMRDFALDDLEGLAVEILGRSEQATRAAIAALPDGRYDEEMRIDGYDRPLTLKARLTVAGDRLSIDFDGTSGLSPFGINVPLTYAKAYTVFGLKCAIAPQIPNNAGALAPFEVVAPEGCIVNAPKPSPVCSRHIVGQLLPDVALGCLHRASAGRVPAEGASTLWDLPIRGRHRESGALYSLELVHNGGTGARPTSDGLSATAFPSGVMGSLVEMTESVAPLLVRRRELRDGSGGPGRFRGGLGQVIELESSEEEAIQLFATVDRIDNPARGRDGGAAGAAGVLRLASGRRLRGKGMQEIPAGDRLVVLTPGGGGYGPAWHRSSAAVAADVRDGRLDPVAAERDYGVVLDAGGDVDGEATKVLRAKGREHG